MLAYSQGLSNDFLLFSSDTSAQVLFNPARAGTSGTQFAYTNYLPGSNSPISVLQTSSLISSSGSLGLPSSSGPTISAATLFNAGGSPWLLEVSNWSYRNTNDLGANIASSVLAPPLTDESGTSTSTRNGSLTALKLSRISGITGDTYSFGVFGILFPGNVTSNSSASSNTHSPAGSTTLTDHDFRSNSNRNDVSSSKYAAGLEFAMAEPTWDFITAISVQKNTIRLASSNTSSQQYHYTNPTDTVTSSQYQNQSSSLTNDPLGVGFHSYFQHTTDLISSTDHYFISTNAYYSNGSLSFNQVGNSTASYYHNSDISSGDTTMTSLNGTEKAKNWGASISVGYLIKQKMIDIDILVGFNPQFNYDDFKEASSPYYYFSGLYYNQSTLINYHQIWTASAQVPIYLNYCPASWFSLFGGINYKYSYVYEKMKSFQPQQSVYTQATSTVSEQTLSETASLLNSASSAYAGAELRHASGLHLQMAFRGSVSSYSVWNISLGYVY